ncbi:MAG: aminoglycoside phosphotransferase [Armatimonadetes bacterium]|nr:aminoglycoside phosphotransferase [Armatimonadota bacterium]
MFHVPQLLAANCHGVPESSAWLKRLPHAVRELQARWRLSLGSTFEEDEGSCAWVAPVVREDGTRAVLKLGMPHFEAEHEIQALCVWDGDPAVRLFEFDVGINAMLLERCEPGTALRALPEVEQDVVLAALLQRLWRRPSAPHPFRPLAAMTAHWSEETRAAASRWPDRALTQAGLRLLEELSRPSPDDVLLATDLHAGNVLQAQRMPWLVIDPKPFVGDRAYDATQHLLNCSERIHHAPDATIRRLSDLLEVDHERVRLWMFARAAAEPRDHWGDGSTRLARLLG